MPDETTRLYFQFFTEIGIIEQLSRNMLEHRLPDGLTMAHFVVVNHLIRVGDGNTPLRIANALQVPKTSLTHTLAGLEKRGMIEMRANPDDGRSKQVWVTEAGRAMREQAMNDLAPDMFSLEEAFCKDRIVELMPKLAEIRAFLDAARD